jgi:hypothetical protein
VPRAKRKIRELLQTIPEKQLIKISASSFARFFAVFDLTCLVRHAATAGRKLFAINMLQSHSPI